MTRNSMGQFMAALRKANGMTQQEAADRLNVSNKAVSRWERDECAPDITLLPAIAEMYGVTCDELLRGERIHKDAAVSEVKDGTAERGKTDKRVERQRKAVINRSLSSFKTMLLISMALSAVGLICMFGISYGFYRPVIGFAVLLLLEAAAVVLAVIAVNKLKEIKTESEFFEEVDAQTLERYDNCLGGFSFAGFFAAFSAVVLSLPLVLCRSAYVKSVLKFHNYLLYFAGIVLVLTLLFLLARDPYMRWITGRKREVTACSRNCLFLNLIQLAAWAAALLLAILLPYFAAYVPETGEIETKFAAGRVIWYILMAVVPVAFVVFLFREKEKRRAVLLTGLRNIFLLPTVFLCAAAHKVDFSYNVMLEQSYRMYDMWNQGLLYFAIGWAIAVIIVFLILNKRFGHGGRALRKY